MSQRENNGIQLSRKQKRKLERLNSDYRNWSRHKAARMTPVSFVSKMINEDRLAFRDYGRSDSVNLSTPVASDDKFKRKEKNSVMP